MAFVVLEELRVSVVAGRNERGGRRARLGQVKRGGGDLTWRSNVFFPASQRPSSASERAAGSLNHRKRTLWLGISFEE